MPNPATTKMSSKGQVVIPEEIRERLGLRPGTRFVVLGDDGVVVLKQIQPPSMSEFDEVVTEARRQAREAGLERSDIEAALAEVRGRR